MKKYGFILGALGLIFSLYLVGYQASAQAQNPVPDPDLVALGKELFFDENLSANGTQACAACHAPNVGFTGPDSQVNTHGAVYPGALPNRFGNRKPPAAAYAGDSPLLHYDTSEGSWVGGMFWDGRATGAVLGDPLAEQAQGPFLNPLEQAMPDAHAVCMEVASAAYADYFEEVWGQASLDCAGDVTGTYERIARSIAAYERSPEVNPFTSKFDQFWDNAKIAHKDVTKIKIGGNRDPNRWQVYRGLGLTDTELQGLAAFNDPSRANCAACHALSPGSAGYPLFTDFTYHNLGVPKNPENPFYAMPPEWNPEGVNWIDYGLGGYLKSAGYSPQIYNAEMGKHKVPTLRNVDLRPSQGVVKAYTHNGYFKSLSDIVRFYACRGMMGGGGMGGGGMGGGGMGGGGKGGGGMGGGGMGCSGFPEPEINQNLASLKSFCMMDQSNIVAFLKTLSDGYFSR